MIKINKLDENDSKKLAIKLAQTIKTGIIFLHGNLGAGKTFLCRNWFYALGYKGAVKSPTYTLVEPYIINGINIYHFDLYRLSCPTELEFIGARDYLTANNLCLIEWADKGQGFLPNPDLILNIEIINDFRNYNIRACSDYGKKLLHNLNYD